MAFRSPGLAAASLFVALTACSAAGQRPVPAGTLAFEPCRDVAVAEARCATLTVFENRAANRGRTIPLRIVILPATSGQPLPDPVFFLAGGPGEAASEGVNGFASHALRAQRDLVFVDQRGTGKSHGMTCQFYGPPSNVQSYFGDFMPLDRIRTCRDELSRDADLAQYTTANTVEDLEDVRVALKYPQIDLIGGSYGTRLAMEYVRAHEKQTRVVVLYGAVSPLEAMPERFGRMAQRGLDRLLAECAATPACHEAFPAIEEEARAVFQRLAAAPVTTTLTIEDSPHTITLTRDMMAESIRYMTYSSGQASRVPLYLHRASGGDFSPIAGDAWRRRREGTFDGLYLAITCTEDVPFLSPRAAEDDEPTYLGSYRVRQQRAACQDWPRGPAPAWHGVPVKANTPILFINGSLDPVTPPEFAEEMRRTLPNTIQVVVPSGGHNLAGLAHMECLWDIERAFVNSGRAEGLDTTCVAQVTRPGFAVR